MTVGIACSDCGEDVVFTFEDETERPTETCDCGATYRLKVEKVYL